MFSASRKANKDYFCKSSDTKPVNGIANGSILLEIDTGKFYVFDEEDGEWVELGAES